MRPSIPRVPGHGTPPPARRRPRGSGSLRGRQGGLRAHPRRLPRSQPATESVPGSSTLPASSAHAGTVPAGRPSVSSLPGSSEGSLPICASQTGEEAQGGRGEPAAPPLGSRAHGGARALQPLVCRGVLRTGDFRKTACTAAWAALVRAVHARPGRSWAGGGDTPLAPPRSAPGRRGGRVSKDSDARQGSSRSSRARDAGDPASARDTSSECASCSAPRSQP